MDNLGVFLAILVVFDAVGANEPNGKTKNVHRMHLNNTKLTVSTATKCHDGLFMVCLRDSVCVCEPIDTAEEAILDIWNNDKTVSCYFSYHNPMVNIPTEFN